MKHVDVRRLPGSAEVAAEDRIIEAFYSRASLFALRFGRAVTYAIAAYLLLSLQQHFIFDHFWMAVAIFTLALVRRSLLIAEASLAIIALSVFVPAGLLQALDRLI